MEENQNNENVNVEENTSTGTNEVNYEEELSTNKRLQSFVDKKVTQGINTALEKAKKQWQLEQDEQKTEAEKMANMTEKQKSEYELKKANKEKENALAELNAYKLKEQAVKVASEKGLEVSLLDLIDFRTITAEKLTESIDNLSTVFNKAVEKTVNEKLRENTPISKVGDATTRKRVSRSSY